MSPVRLALVGAGGIAQAVHLPTIQRNRHRCEVAALVDLSPHRRNVVAARWGVPQDRTFADAAGLAAAVRYGCLEVDAAIIATSGLHCADAATLLDAGLAVLVEKPLAYSLAELGQLESFAKERGIDLGRRLRVGYMKEYDPASVRAGDLLAGLTVRAVTVEVLHPADERQLAFAHLLPPETDVPTVLAERDRRRFGDVVGQAVGAAPKPLRRIYASVLLGSLVHDVALLRHLGLGLDSVQAAYRSGPTPGTVTAHGTTGEGIPWQLGWHYIRSYPEYRETITVHTESGTLSLAFRTPYVLNTPTTLRIDANAAELGRVVTERTWPQSEAFEQELLALLALAQGQPLAGSGPTEAKDDLRTVQRLYRALATAEGVTIDPAAEAATIGSLVLPTERHDS